MARNSNLHNAKRVKQDEFYTQWIDIEREMNAYLEYDPDVFRGKTVLLPCDDPGWSNFTKYFAEQFTYLGLKKLISASYAPKANMEGAFYSAEEAVVQAAHYDPELDYERGKIFVLDGADMNADGKVNKADFHWEYLQGDGDFRSDEVTALRDEADMVITNPPFSLFREFMAWLNEGGAQFSVIGNMNAITYKEIFPLIKNNEMWIGAAGMKAITYEVPVVGDLGKGQFEERGKRYQKMGNTCWFTNIQHGRRHEPLQLLSQADNETSNKRVIKNPNSYKKYDNYDAIEVPVVAGIPSNYAGVMGVPISFLGKYCPEQFEIVGTTDSNEEDNACRTHWYSKEEKLDAYRKRFDKEGSYDLNASGVVDSVKVYRRVLIRHINPEPQGA